MPQTSYAQTLPVGRAGQLVDGPEYSVSRSADEVVRFGIPVVQHQTRANVCKPPRANVCVITDDAGAYTSGTAVVTINGVTLSITYDTNKATTMAAVAAAIQALSFIVTAVYSSPTITITAEEDVDIRGVSLSGMVGGMTISSYTYSNTETLVGIAVRDDALPFGTGRRVSYDKVIATLSGDTLTTSDTVGGYVNGVAFDTVTYATSEGNTLQLLCNALMENPDIYLASYSGRVVTVLARPGRAISLTLNVSDNALSSVAPSFANAYSDQAMPISEAEAAYLPGESVRVLRKGRVWMRAEEALALGDTLYMRVAEGTYTGIGDLRNDTDTYTCYATSGITLLGPTVTDPEGNYIAPVEVNLP